METWPKLKTKRLTLRQLTLDDIDDLVRLAGSREVASTTTQIPHPYTAEDAQKWIADQQKDLENGKAVVFAITPTPHNYVIGSIGLTITPEHNHAELGYWVGKPYWGKGYATEAARKVVEYGFEELKLNRIHAHHFERNQASGRVMKRAGLTREGLFRKHIKKWDNYENIVSYGICRSDYNCPITRAKAARSLIFTLRPI